MTSHTSETGAPLSVPGCRMLRLIEAHSQELSQAVLQRIENRERCSDFGGKMPPDELQQRVNEIYQDLGDWLTHKTEREIELRYTAIGERRASQGISLGHLIFAIIATKEQLWEYVTREVLTDPHPLELPEEVELCHLVERFFDRAIYFAVIGYQRYRTTHGQALGS